MKHYSSERKAAVLAKMMPPQNVRVSLLAEETGISQQTLYNWRQKARDEGGVVPGDGKNSEVPSFKGYLRHYYSLKINRC